MAAPDANIFDHMLQVAEFPVRVFERLSVSLQDRLVGAMLFIPGAMVLGTAMWLTPDPSGMGTHRQLGMGGCTVQVLTGYPCPMCGMTTTFTHLAHLHIVDGTLNQPFGLVLFTAMLVAVVVGGLDLLLPRGRWRRMLQLVERHETLVAVLLLAGMGLGWAYKIVLVMGYLPWSP